jgi:hypothetical protein
VRAGSAALTGPPATAPAARASSTRSDIHAGGAHPVRGGAGGSGARGTGGEVASTAIGRFGAEPSTAVTRGVAGRSKRPDAAASVRAASTRGGASLCGAAARGGGSTAARAGAAEAVWPLSDEAPGRWLGSSHSPHHRHFTAASWIDSAQKGQGFTTDRP